MSKVLGLTMDNAALNMAMGKELARDSEFDTDRVFRCFAPRVATRVQGASWAILP